MDFVLFLLVNLTLFIRPAELMPSTAAWPIYEIVIVANLIAAGPALVNHLAERGLARCPTTFCVFGVLAFIVISHLARFDFWSARYGGFDFAKVVAYFLLLLVVVNTPRRLFTLLAAIVLFTLLLNGLAVLQYHGYVNLPALEVVMEGDYDEITGEAFQFPRMRATGIFNDPNDLSMIIVACMLLASAALLYRSLGMARFTLAAPIGFLFYCLTLTQSRGGLLALLAGIAVLCYGWFGMFRGGVLAAAAAPLALLGTSARQGGIGDALTGGTGAERAEYWSDGLMLFKASPFFGIGYGFYAEEIGHVAHNSFVHGFVELGFFGGSLFLGVFVIATWQIWQLLRVRHEIADPALRHLLPYLLALLAAFCVSMFSLSRNYVIPTYMVAGIAATYFRLAQPGTSVRPLEVTPGLFAWLAAAGVGCIAFVYLYIKFLYR